MRPSFFLILFFLFFGISGEIVLAQRDPFISPEKVPVPLTNESDQETSSQNAFANEVTAVSTAPVSTVPVPTVPVPPDTFANHAEGYVPNIYNRVAPDPASVLRPRYRNSAANNNTEGKQAKKSNTASKETQHPIRQVSASDAPVPPTEDSLISPSSPSSPSSAASSSASPSQTAASSKLKYPISLTPQKKRSNPAQNQTQTEQQNPYTVNNTHSCDELTCGEGGCSFSSSNGLSLHLSDQIPRRGLCPCCGFLRCVNKTAGNWYFDGWFSVGSFMNMDFPKDRNNSPLYYNDRNAEAVMNQLYLTFGRRINPRGGRWDIGGRIDLLYGTDYFYTNSVGLETRRSHYFLDEPTLEPLEAAQHWNSNSGTRRLGTASLYGLSLPQAYAELFVPFGGGVTVKAGHFYSGMGIESAMSPENFFYSRSYSFMYGSPTTLTGATATVKLNSRLSALLGFSRGWDIFDKSTNRLSGLAGLEWKSFDKRTSLSFLVHSGEESFRKGDNRTNYTLTLQHQLAPRWRYALEHTFGYEKNGAALSYDLYDVIRGPARWYSFAQYLQWEWSERFALGLRGEWFRDDGQSRIQKDFVDSYFYRLEGNDYFQITLGANWKPTRFITIRPEIRYDWSTVVVKDNETGAKTGIYSNNKKEMLSFAIDGIFRF
ncbi:MAG: porin [Planctomycetaceae bacterium]|nr:porin [Planctomycetaceae bacterium]